MIAALSPPGLPHRSAFLPVFSSHTQFTLSKIMQQVSDTISPANSKQTTQAKPSVLKRIIRRLLITVLPVTRPLLCLFFQSKYLTGRHFDGHYIGYLWAFKSIWINSILRLGKPMPWPTGLGCVISNAQNIEFHPDNMDNFQSQGTYFQNFSARIQIGRGCYIAQNVGIITANHIKHDLDKHEPGKDVVLGADCWIGVNAVILPGVILGDRCIVGAGAIVTKSHRDGYVVLAGNPARVINTLDRHPPV
jgi:hypothetical protein